MGSHQCPGPNCIEQIPIEWLACRRHWYQVPKEIRNLVWSEYKHQPWSESHIAAIAAAIETMREL